MQPEVLNIPEAMRKVWTKFAAAVTEKPEHFNAAMAILCKHADTDLLKLLVHARPADVATTILAYLPASVRPLIVEKLKSEPALKQQVLDTIKTEQNSLKSGIWELIREGKHPELRKVVAA